MTEKGPEIATGMCSKSLLSVLYSNDHEEEP